MPLLLPSFGEPDVKYPDANVSYDKFSTESDKYNLVVNVNDIKNSDYLIIRHPTEHTKIEVSRCINNETITDIDYEPNIIVSECDTALVKGLYHGDNVRVIGDNGYRSIISDYTVKSSQ